MKKRCTILLLVLLMLLLALPVSAESANKVYDEADLLTAQEEAALQAHAEELVEKYQIDIILVTCKDTGGKSYRAYADDFYDNHGCGIGKNFDGALFLVSMEERYCYVSTCGSALDSINDDVIYDLEEDYLPYLRYGEVADAMECFLNGVDGALKAAAFRPIRNILIGAAVFVILGLIVAFFVTFSMEKSMNSANFQRQAAAYAVTGGVQLAEKRDIFTHTTTVRTPKANSNGSGPGGHGSGGSHTSSAGRSHGGHGRSF